jgi:hypothetical protein
VNDSQHNDFACTVFVSQGNEGAFVSRDLEREDIDARVEETQLLTAVQAP